MGLAHDAEALAAVLRDPEICGFEVTTLFNEPNHRVGEAMTDFYRDRRGNDLTLLYFTGRGLKDDDGRLHLAMRNTRRDSLIFTAISGEQIDYAMERCASRRKVLILDCCYSGAYPAGRLTKAGGDWTTSAGVAAPSSLPPTPPSTPSKATRCTGMHRNRCSRAT
ncbi:caspase family protein [Nonomuraea sp. NPDC026600]|uniref:caspase family protein n=1 Tax=Nonomuraea sp. NPDC026600 TaxID=3155363 RepID=UPI0033F91880